MWAIPLGDAWPCYGTEKQAHRPHSLFETKGDAYTQFHANMTGINALQLPQGLCSRFL